MEQEPSGIKSKPRDEEKSVKVVSSSITIGELGCLLVLLMMVSFAGMFVIGVVGASFDWWTK